MRRLGERKEGSPERSELERLVRFYDPPAIDDRPGSGHPTWLEANGWRLLARPGLDGSGEEIQRFLLPDGRAISARLDPGTGRVNVPFSLAEVYLNYVHETWRRSTRLRALSPRQLAAYYHLKRFIPRPVQLSARRVLIRLQGDPEFPRWPLDESVFRLLRFYAKCALLTAGETDLPFIWFWPRPYKAAALLTHDVESAEGLRLSVDIADAEEERGFRSLFNVVADEYPIDWGIVRELRDRGFELGVHGLHHDRSMFSSRAAFDAQQPGVKRMAEKLGAEGFRSPALHRVVDWLGDLPVSYDCTVPHSDPYEPQPGGCCSLWPFFIKNLVELPITLPQDHLLLALLGHRTIAVWQTQLERIELMNGLAQILTHPDKGYLGEPKHRALYVEFLDFLRDRSDLWIPLPREAAEWWRSRDAGHDVDGRFMRGAARLDGEGTVTLAPESMLSRREDIPHTVDVRRRLGA